MNKFFIRNRLCRTVVVTIRAIHRGGKSFSYVGIRKLEDVLSPKFKFCDRLRRSFFLMISVPVVAGDHPSERVRVRFWGRVLSEIASGLYSEVNDVLVVHVLLFFANKAECLFQFLLVALLFQLLH